MRRVFWLPLYPERKNLYAILMKDASSILETFANPHPGRDYTILHVAPEFTSICPKTGQPDFGTVRLRYVPDKLCVELKSYKFYLQTFRNEGIFYEAVTNRIATDLAKILKPRWLKLETDWRPRGGISTKVSLEIGRRRSS